MKLEAFPDLLNDQVALIRAEKATGIVLDDQFKWHISDEQVFYSVFENCDKAREYIELCKRADVEYNIYGKDHELIFSSRLD